MVRVISIITIITGKLKRNQYNIIPSWFWFDNVKLSTYAIIWIKEFGKTSKNKKLYFLNIKIDNIIPNNNEMTNKATMPFISFISKKD